MTHVKSLEQRLQLESAHTGYYFHPLPMAFWGIDCARSLVPREGGPKVRWKTTPVCAPLQEGFTVIFLFPGCCATSSELTPKKEAAGTCVGQVFPQSCKGRPSGRHYLYHLFLTLTHRSMQSELVSNSIWPPASNPFSI